MNVRLMLLSTVVFSSSCRHKVTSREIPTLPPIPNPSSESPPSLMTTITTVDAPIALSVNFASRITEPKMLLVFGDPKSKTQDGAIFDVATESWQPIPANIDGLSVNGATIALLGKRLIVWGGIGSELSMGAFVDLPNGEWKLLSTVGAPSNRYDHSAMLWSSRIVIFGGSSKGGARTDGGIYDQQSNTWEAIPSYEKQLEHAHSVVTAGLNLIGDGLFVFSQPKDERKVIVTRFDLVAKTWKAVPLEGAPELGINPRMHALGDKLVIVSQRKRENDNLVPNRVWGIYDPAARTWRKGACI